MARQYFLKAVLLGTAACYLASPASANSKTPDKELQDLLSLDLNELSVSVASKRQEKISEAPGIVDVITAEDISRYGGNNLHDLLERLPNTYANLGNEAHHHGNIVSVRGQEPVALNTRVLILLNGRPMREGMFSGLNSPVYRAFPLTSVERIEVIRGPGSVLYGDSAFSGVINIITKKAKVDSQSFSSGYGSFDSKSGNASFERKFNGGGIFVDAKYNLSEGWNKKVTDVTGTFGSQHAGYDSYSIHYNTDYKGFTVNGYSAFSKEDIIGGVALWPASQHKFRWDFIDLGYNHNINEDWEASFNVSSTGFSNNSVGFDTNSFNTVFYEASTKGKVWDKFNIVAGATHEVTNGVMQNSATRNVSSEKQSGYLQIDRNPIDSLKLIAGLQLNKPQGLDHDISPRLGAIYNFTKQTGLKILHGQAFREANSAETKLFISGAIEAQPDVKPEKISTTDIQLFHAGSNYEASITYYQSKVEDNIIIRTKPSSSVLTWNNSSGEKYHGIELEGKYLYNKDLEFTGSTSYQYTKIIAGADKDSGRSPRFMTKVGASYTGFDGYKIGIFNSYYGNPVNNDVVIRNPDPSSHDILTANVNANLSEIWELKDFPQTDFSLYGDNLLNESVYILDSNNQVNSMPIRSGRAFYGTLKIKF